MRTIDTQIYRFDELSDEAKQRAKDAYAAACGATSHFLMVLRDNPVRRAISDRDNPSR